MEILLENVEFRVGGRRSLEEHDVGAVDCVAIEDCMLVASEVTVTPDMEE